MLTLAYCILAFATLYAVAFALSYAITRGHLEGRTDSSICAARKWAEAKIPTEEQPEERKP